MDTGPPEGDEPVNQNDEAETSVEERIDIGIAKAARRKRVKNYDQYLRALAEVENIKKTKCTRTRGNT